MTSDASSHGLELMPPAPPDALLPDAALWPWLVAAAIAVLVILAIRRVLSHPPPTTARRSVRDVARAVAANALATPMGDPRETAVQSSLILRRYLTAAAGDPALYETHEEWVARHDALQVLTADARAAALNGFERLAALKYAPSSSGIAAEAVLTDARQLLETLHHGFTP